MTNGFHERRVRLRAILTGHDCIYPASVYDPLSARAAEDLGYEMCNLGGSTAALAVLGAPDLVLLTLTEYADQARRISRASELPLLADADHGYGNALNVKRTVEELEVAGVAALTIEDTLLPARYGSAPRPEMISIEEGVGKMRAALSGRRDPSLVIVGRTSAVRLAGIDDAIARARAYAAAGVDALFFSFVSTRAELEAIGAATNLPLIMGSLPAEMADRAYLASNKVRIALQGNAPLIAAVDAAYSALKALREGSAVTGEPASGLVKRLSRDDDYQRLRREFL